MSTPSARLSLRYRPGSDVLSGEIDLGPREAELVSHSPDTDSSIVWSRSADSLESRDDLLSSFRLVHASARWKTDSLHLLPTAVGDLARDLMSSGSLYSVADSSSLDRVRAQWKRTAELPHEALRRRPPASDTPSGTVGEAGPLATALVRLADSVGERSSYTEREALRSDHLTHALRELASVIASGEGKPAPGTSAAARSAVRGGIPLTVNEQRKLRNALVLIDTPSNWATVRDDIDQVSSALATPPPGPRS